MLPEQSPLGIGERFVRACRRSVNRTSPSELEFRKGRDFVKTGARVVRSLRFTKCGERGMCGPCIEDLRQGGVSVRLRQWEAAPPTGAPPPARWTVSRGRGGKGRGRAPGRPWAPPGGGGRPRRGGPAPPRFP